MKIGMLVGSLRKDSFNKKVALVLKQLAPSSLQIELIDISQLPLFNQDLEDNPPSAWTTFRNSISAQDGILLITPEYNRSVPAVLKNAIDVGSRPYGHSVWAKKPCAIISASIGAIGGFGANHHLRQSLVFLDMPCMQQPEIYLSQVDKLFDEQGQLKEATQSFLKDFLKSYVEWVKTNKS